MHSHRRKIFLLSATILGVVAATSPSQTQQNNPNMSQGLGGSPSARPDSSMFNQGPGVPGAFPGLDTFSKGDNKRGKQGGSIEDKVTKEQQRLQTRKQDGLEKTKSSSKGTTEGSPQPDPPSRVPGSAAVQPELKAGVPGKSALIPSGLEERLQDKAIARAIDELKKLQDSGIGLPERQAGRPGQTSPQLGSGFPGNIPESNTKDPAPRQRPSAEDILAGRGFGGSRDDKHDIAKGYPGAAGGAVPDRRGQASEDYWMPVPGTLTNNRNPDGSSYSAGTYRNSGGFTVSTASSLRSDRTYYAHTTVRDPNNNVISTTETEASADGWTTETIKFYENGRHTKTEIAVYQVDGNPAYEISITLLPGGTDQPVPDDGRISGRDNCNWAPGIGCLNRRVDVKDMIGQPGRGESGGTPVSGLPDSSHVTNPAEGREGPVGFRAPPNPGGPSSPDPSRGGTNPPPR